MGNSLLHVLQTDTKLIRARIEMNGFEVFSEPVGQERLAQTKMNPYVIEGDNTISVFLGPVLDDELRPTAMSTSAYCRVSLIVAPHGARPPPEAVRRDWRWPQKDPEIPLELPTLIPVWSTVFTATKEETYGRWCWQDAPDIEIADRDRNEIGDVVREIHTLLAGRDSRALCQALRLKHQEMSRALNVPLSEIETGYTDFLENLFEDARGRMDPLVPASFLLRKVAGGRVVLVTTQSGEPPIQGRWRDKPFRFATMVANIEGRWKIIR